MGTELICCAGVSFLAGTMLLSLAVKVVPEYKRLVIHRLGVYRGIYGPGIVLVIPIIDQIVTKDVRELTPEELTRQE